MDFEKVAFYLTATIFGGGSVIAIVVALFISMREAGAFVIGV